MFRIAFEAISPKSIEDLSKRFYDAFDGVLSERGGRITVAVYCDGESRVEAAIALVSQLESIGFCIVRIDQDIVDGPEIALRLGVTRQAVNQWAKGTRGTAFPHPVSSPGGKRLWTWGQITAWAPAKYDEATALTQDEAVQVDHVLTGRRIAAGGGQRIRVHSLLGGEGGSKVAQLAGDYDAGDVKLVAMGHYGEVA